LLKSPPITLTIAGSDCSAGAGVQADLKTFQALQTYGLTVISGVVAETPNEVVSWKAVPAILLEDQLSCLLNTYHVSAIKTGLLFNTELVTSLVKALKPHPTIPLVIDPIGAASSGTRFTDSSYLKAMGDHLFPLAALITPNLSEAQALCNSGSTDLSALATEIAQLYGTNILVKGGHTDDEYATDTLASNKGAIQEFSLPRINGPDFHGTGCTLSAAIAAQLAHGKPLSVVIRGATSMP